MVSYRYKYNPVETLALFVRGHFTKVEKIWGTYADLTYKQSSFIRNLDDLNEAQAHLSARIQFRDIVNQTMEDDSFSLGEAFTLSTRRVAWASHRVAFDEAGTKSLWSEDQKHIMDTDIKDSSFAPSVLALVNCWAEKDSLAPMPDVIVANYIYFGEGGILTQHLP